MNERTFVSRRDKHRTEPKPGLSLALPVAAPAVETIPVPTIEVELAGQPESYSTPSWLTAVSGEERTVRTADDKQLAVVSVPGKRECGTCVWWCPLSNSVQRTTGGLLPARGYCTYYPAVVRRDYGDVQCGQWGKSGHDWRKPAKEEESADG